MGKYRVQLDVRYFATVEAETEAIAVEAASLRWPDCCGHQLIGVGLSELPAAAHVDLRVKDIAEERAIRESRINYRAMQPIRPMGELLAEIEEA